MLKNDKQYQTTLNKIKKFKESITQIENDKNFDLYSKKIQTNAINSQIDSLEKEIYEYEQLKKGCISYINLDSISNINEALIKARIIKGWSQAKLAKKLLIKEQQVQRYELTNYSTASIGRISEVVNALDITEVSIKLKIKEPTLELPSNLSPHIVKIAQQKINNRKTLMQF